MPDRLRAFAGDLSDTALAEFTAALRDFFAQTLPGEATAVAEDPGGWSAKLWPRLVAELDVAGLALPEAYGGSGLGMRAHAVVQREAGRLLAHTPYLASIALAGSALLAVDDVAAQERYLPRLATGDLTATLVLGDDPGINAAPGAGGYVLSGTAPRVLDGATADVLFVRAKTPDGVGLFAVRATAAAVERTVLQTLDLTRPMANVTLAEAEGELIGPLEQEQAQPPLVCDAGAIALAAEALGAAEHSLDRAVRHARERYQFGRPIGSFQAVKHQLADMRLAVDRALFGVDIALGGVDVGLADSGCRSSLALVTAVEALTHVAQQAMQVYGGLSITWEHPAHLYLRRAHSTAQLLGPLTTHRERFLVRQ
ncbi:acyl-CoA dehydrogenase family protein [Amycolatopsis sp. GM8]|uniref:acyl-CoA dehydrogenase family protein n=1 Tax=Amycolatopsis sp. GM8 TaxID=2896530 RepID=UPI001F31D287|nr:acyl-CoA dehydrogenase family protein [Amycolatopsis sp. GM8]